MGRLYFVLGEATEGITSSQASYSPRGANWWNIWTTGVTIVPHVPANSAENFGVKAFGAMS